MHTLTSSLNIEKSWKVIMTPILERVPILERGKMNVQK